jgi:hypothetical protein
MSVDLRKEVAEFATRYVNGRVPVLIGTGTPSTNENISLSLHAKGIGADGIVFINPYYYKLTEESLFQHYAEIAELEQTTPHTVKSIDELWRQIETAKKEKAIEVIMDLAARLSNYAGAAQN